MSVCDVTVSPRQRCFLQYPCASYFINSTSERTKVCSYYVTAKRSTVENVISGLTILAPRSRSSKSSLLGTKLGRRLVHTSWFTPRNYPSSTHVYFKLFCSASLKKLVTNALGRFRTSHWLIAAPNFSVNNETAKLPLGLLD